MKWLKKWCYLILFTVSGLAYLTFVDGWQVYAGALGQVKEWCSGLGTGSVFPAEGPAESPLPEGAGDGTAVGGGNGTGEPGGAAGDGSGGNGTGEPGGAAGEGSGGNGTGEPGGAAGEGSGGNGAGEPGGVSGNGSGTGEPGGAAGNGGGTGVPGGAAGEGSGGDGTGEPGGAAGNGSGAGMPGGAAGNGSGTGEPGGAAGNGSGAGMPGEAGNGSGTGEPGGAGNGSGTGVPGGAGDGSGAGAPGDSALPEVQYAAVEDDYFADAVFIGDSRTVGLFEYGGLEETAAFYASKGLTVYKMFEAQIVDVPGERKKITVEEALQQNSFGKIYLMIGINEMGTGTVESFLEKYQEVVDHLRELQPDAVIYLQAIIKVTSERSAQGDYINNEGIIARNEGIAKLADNEKIFFLDVNPLVCDETGGMIPDYTFDGVHLKAKYIGIWKDYLKSHAISS